MKKKYRMPIGDGKSEIEDELRLVRHGSIYLKGSVMKDFNLIRRMDQMTNLQTPMRSLIKWRVKCEDVQSNSDDDYLTKAMLNELECASRYFVLKLVTEV